MYVFFYLLWFVEDLPMYFSIPKSLHRSPRWGFAPGEEGLADSEWVGSDLL